MFVIGLVNGLLPPGLVIITSDKFIIVSFGLYK